MLLAAVLLVISKYHLIQQWVFGTVFSPEMSRTLVMVFSGLFCAFIQLVCLTAILDMLLVAAWMAQRGCTMKRQHHTWARYTIGIAVLLLCAIGVQQAMKAPNVRRIELTLHDLPHGMDGFRLVQMTDLHISRFLNGPWVRQIVARTNALNPDLIVITGDLIDGAPKARRDDVDPLRDLRAKHGVVTILGNHEYYFDASQWTTMFEQLGMVALGNAYLRIATDGAELVVAGVNDTAALAHGLPGPDAARALSGVSHESLTVLLTHRPVDTAAHTQAGVDLQLAGHIQGGMIPGFDALVICTCMSAMARESGMASLFDWADPPR